MSEVIYRAKWIFPVSSKPLRDGWVAVANRRIVALGDATAPAPAIDLGDVALLPMLVNAHTHLEFSEYAKPLGQPGMSFPDWISEVVKQRQQSDPQLQLINKQLAIASGLQESWRCGVGSLGEIASLPWSAAWYSSPLQVTLFHEILGMQAQRVESHFERCQQQLADGFPDQASLAFALSPHAPYTVSRSTVARAAELAAQAGIPIAMHLAESAEEMELLSSQTGPFRELLERVGAWIPTCWSTSLSARDYLEALSHAPRAQVVHGNYLENRDWNWLAERRAQFTLVHCPRTHDYFQHAVNPVRSAFQAGVRIALGTDSRASNPDLNLWQEARFAARNHTDLPAELWLKASTCNAAYALGIEERAGQLSQGRFWQPAVIELGPDAPKQPDLEWLLHRCPNQPRPLSIADLGKTHFA